MLRFLALAFVSQALVVNHSATRTAASNMTTPANDTVVVPAPASNSTPSNSSVVVPTPVSNSTPPSNSTNAPKAPVAVSPPVNGSSGSNSTNSTVPTNSSSPKSNSSNPVPVPVIAPKAAEPTSAYKIVYSNFTSEPTMNQKNRLREHHAAIAEVPSSQVDVESSSYTVRALAYSVTVTMRNTKVEPTLLAARAQALASSPAFQSEFPYVTQSAVQSSTGPADSLSGSAIAAIVVCSIVGAMLIVGVVAFLVHRYVLRGGQVAAPKTAHHHGKEGHHHHHHADGTAHANDAVHKA